jgi:hypothetical protein
MTPKDTAQEASGTPDPVERGFATLATLRYVGLFTRASWNTSTTKSEEPANTDAGWELKHLSKRYDRISVIEFDLHSLALHFLPVATLNSAFAPSAHFIRSSPPLFE